MPRGMHRVMSRVITQVVAGVNRRSVLVLLAELSAGMLTALGPTTSASALVGQEPSEEPLRIGGAAAPVEGEAGEAEGMEPDTPSATSGPERGEVGGDAGGSLQPPGAGRQETAADPDPATLFGEAVQAYESGEYGLAVSRFRQLAEIGPENASAQYNLGNALLRSGELGGAIAAYRRARSLAPRDEDVLANLQFARTSARDAIAAPDPGAVPRTLVFWHFGFSRVERIWIAVVAGLAFWSAIALVLLRRAAATRRWLAAVGGVVLIAMLASLAFDWWRGASVAVVLAPQVDARTAPEASGVVRFKLHAGTEVRALEERGDWILIALPDGERGWIESRFVERTV